MAKIVKISFISRGTFGPVHVIANFDNGEEEEIFNYFSDELHFTKAELIGKTKEEVINLHFQKDQAYLKS